jgi:hypothetical protein
MMSSTLPGPPLAHLLWPVPNAVQIFDKKAPAAQANRTCAVRAWQAGAQQMLQLRTHPAEHAQVCTTLP